MRLLFVFLLFFVAEVSYAHFVANFQAIDSTEQRTHLLIAGRGDDLGRLFQSAAITKAKKYRSIFPQDQIIFITVDEVSSDVQRKFLNADGFQKVDYIPGSLNADLILSYASKFKKIASIDFYTHAAVKFGLRIDTTEDRFEVIDNWQSLKDKLTDDAYIYFYGCNTGFELAPAVAKILQHPVAGSLTSTDFQRLAADQQFYIDSGAKKERIWAIQNIASYEKPESCQHDSCYRMRPDNHPYIGYWGEFGGGLPFYKFFCADLPEDKCQKTMALSMLSEVNQYRVDINKEKYQQAVFDFLCPGSKSSTVHQQCEANLLLKNRLYSPFVGSLLRCSFQKCDFELICKDFDDKCRLNNPVSKADTLYQEYQAYMQGFDLLYFQTHNP